MRSDDLFLQTGFENAVIVSKDEAGRPIISAFASDMGECLVRLKDQFVRVEPVEGRLLVTDKRYQNLEDLQTVLTPKALRL